MTTFFDTRTRDVADLQNYDLSDATWLRLVAWVERPVINLVSIVVGDREFPDELRERLLGIIAVHTLVDDVLEPSEATREMALTCRTSELLSRLHSAFHDVANSRTTTRFGLLSDDPTDILTRRDDHDSTSLSDEFNVWKREA